ncbi:MAG: VIT domain-containing protein [Phycisphaerae bacterium]|nr:VIT domain-containing protein [Phycisphaerae bacterium]
MNDRTNSFRIMDTDDAGPPPHDDLDSLLRDWHQEHADLAHAKRAEILAAVTAEGTIHEGGHEGGHERGPERSRIARRVFTRPVLARVGHAVTGRMARIAAALVLVATLATIVLVPTRNTASADVINVPEGGELTAFTADGDRLGPCPLQHTAVDAEVTGPVTRVSIKQLYKNPYHQKVEATYTFPLSHRSAVDRMRITVKGPDGAERIVEGEVKERTLARQMYESAKRAGYVASLLEQERSNIFTQSVANIEPGASVTVEISYLEFLQRKDGVYSFDFPMVVGPRYIPGTPSLAMNQLAEGLQARAGLVLLGPAEVTITSTDATLPPQALQSMLASAQAIRTPSPAWMERPAAGLQQPLDFVVTYTTGAKEQGQYFEQGGIGQLNGRWFSINAKHSGAGFAADTNQVPDASRITPMPVKPTERAGHDVSVRVTIDTGGPPVFDVKSELHDVVERAGPRAGATTIELKSKTAIPNRDFALSWKSSSDTIGQGVLTHVRNGDDATKGGYFAVILDPPARPRVEEIPSRELIFVLDTSGSMSGFPIEKAKELMTKAIGAMRPADTFNIITFAGDTHVLWPEPRTATEENRRAATQFVEGRRGGGGTEMMKAFEAALNPRGQRVWTNVRELVNLPADGRTMQVEALMSQVDTTANTIALGDGKVVQVTFGVSIPTSGMQDQTIRMTGRWMTSAGDRVFVVDNASFARSDIVANRMVFLLTDGAVGNDQAIVQMVRDNAKTTRVFSFGIGNSVNRALLDGAARAGRGVAEFVTLASNADEAVARLTRRIQSPVLIDIEATFAGVEVEDLLPTLEQIPDLYDNEPLVLLGRYKNAGKGMVTVRGRNGAGPWERTIALDLPATATDRSSLATLWARAKVDTVIAPVAAAIEQGNAPSEVKAEIVALGENYGIMTPFTSFVAIEKSRVTVGGTPMLVQIPIELPEGTSWQGFFGEGVSPAQWALGQPGSDATLGRRLELVSKLSEDVRTIRHADSLSDDAADARLWFAEQVSIDQLAAISLGFDGDGTSAGAGEDTNGGVSSDVRRLTSASGAYQFSPAPPAPSNGNVNYIGATDTSAAGGTPISQHVFQSTSAMPGKRKPTSAPVPAPSGPGVSDGRGGGGLERRAAAKPGDRGETPPAPPAPAKAAEPALAAPPVPPAPSELTPANTRDQQPTATGAAKVVENEVLRKDEKKDEKKDEFSFPWQRGQADEPLLTKEASDAPAADGADKAVREHAAGELTEKPAPARPTQLSAAERDLLARRIERSLLLLALAAQIDQPGAIELARTLQAAPDIDADSRTRVTMLILATNADEFAAALRQLKTNGVEVEASDVGSKLVIARVRIRDLMRVGLLDPIRRIEACRASPEKQGG